jgi:hypothetical protein
VTELSQKPAPEVVVKVESLPEKTVETKTIEPPTQSEDDRKRRRDESALLLLLLGFWTEQQADILSIIDPKDHKPLTSNPKWDAQLSAALLGGMLPIGFRSAQESSEDIGIDDAMRVNSRVHEHLQEVADEFAPLINQTTIDRVNSAIAGVTPGADNAEDLLRSAIGQVFEDAAEGRGPTIAGDTAFIADQAGTLAPGTVANEARDEETPPGEELTPTGEASGEEGTSVPPSEATERPVVTAEWITAEDDRVCVICAPMDGRIVIAGDEFAPGINLPTIDTHPKCRCRVRLGTKPINYPPTT